jgi:hypothetical protein
VVVVIAEVVVVVDGIVRSDIVPVVVSFRKIEVFKLLFYYYYFVSKRF